MPCGVSFIGSTVSKRKGNIYDVVFPSRGHFGKRSTGKNVLPRPSPLFLNHHPFHFPRTPPLPINIPPLYLTLLPSPCPPCIHSEGCTPCVFGTREVGECQQTSDRLCKPCTECGEGEYQSRECRASGEDRICETCLRCGRVHWLLVLRFTIFVVVFERS